jgi:pyruvate dehydrogenase E2 component (dihydrolipoyllysine-residue acetyltransferase)
MEFLLPALPGTPTVTLAKWFKQAGERVSMNETLLAAYSDSIDWDIPAQSEGVLREIRIAPETSVSDGQVLGIIDAPATNAQATVSPPAVSAQLAQPPAAPRITPLAAAIAAEHSLDFGALVGSGVGGQVTKHDVLAAIEERRPVAPAATPISTMDPVAEVSSDVQHLSTTQSLNGQFSPQASIFIAVDVSNVSKQQEAQQALWQRREGFALDFLPFILLAVVNTLRDMVELNAQFNEPGIRLRKSINLTLVPADAQRVRARVIPNAESYNLVGMARRVHKALSQTSDVDNADGCAGTFAICDRSASGALLCSDIIPRGHTALLTLGTIRRRSVVVDDELAIRPVVYLGLTFDQRLIDDLTADRFVGAVKQRIETAVFR